MSWTSNGQIFEQAFGLKGNVKGTAGTSLVTDSNRNIYVTGYFVGDLDLDPGPGTHIVTASGAYPSVYSDIFVAKYDSNENLLWGYSFGDGQEDIGTDITIDDSGYVYVVGTFYSWDSVDFDPGPNSHYLTPGVPNDKIFVLKLDSAGGFVWVKQFTSSAGRKQRINNIILDDSANLYLPIKVTDNTNLNPNASTSNMSFGTTGGFVLVKLSRNGDFNFAKVIGSNVSSSSHSYEVAINDAWLNDSGQIIGIASFYGTWDFDPSSGTDLFQATNHLVFKLDSAGNIIWVTSIEGGGKLHAVASNSYGDIYLSGTGLGGFDYDPGQDSFFLSCDSPCHGGALLMKLNGNGEFGWAHLLQKTCGNCGTLRGEDLALDSLGQPIVIGYYQNAFDINPDTSKTLTISGAGGATFVARFDTAGNLLNGMGFGINESHGFNIRYREDHRLYTTGGYGKNPDFDPGLGSASLQWASSGVYIQSMYLCEPSYWTDEIQTCDSFLWIDGVMYYSSIDSATFTLPDVHGCDSVIRLDLTIGISGSDSIVACDSFVWDNHTYSTSGSFDRTFTSSSGCDSVHTLELTILYSSTDTSQAWACDSFIWDSTVYSSSGFYQNTYINAVGCDSVHTLDLTIDHSNFGTHNVTSCDSFSWDGSTYKVNGSYSKVYKNMAGCDSLHTLNLTINPSSFGSSSVESCDSFTWLGTTYYASGPYSKTLVNVLGCDSVHTLNLTLNSPTVDTTNLTACDQFIWDGTTYTSSGTYNKTFVNSNGCDSVHTLDLVLNSSTTGIDIQTACDSFVWIDQATYYSSNQTAIYTLSNTKGCDSLVTLDLTLYHSTVSNVQEKHCAEYFSPTGKIYTESGVYQDTLTGHTGCDSIVVIDLQIIHIDTAVSIDAGVITSLAKADSFQWIYCDSAGIFDQINSTFSPKTNGTYAVELKSEGCVDTSACVPINFIKVDQTNVCEFVYPNPTDGLVNINLGDGHEMVGISLFSTDGKQILDHRLDGVVRYSFQINAASELYILRIELAEGTFLFCKVVAY